MQLDARKRVFDQVVEYPGLHLREIARSTGLDPNHVKYHLTFLEKHGLVSSKKEDGYWRFFPRGEGSFGTQDVVPAQDKKVLSLLRKPVPLHITLLLLDRGRVPVQDLTIETGLARSTLYYHISKMEKQGLVKADKQGRERVYSLVDHDATLNLLIRYKPPDALVKGFLDAWEALEI